MKDKDKTKEQLVSELVDLRQRIAEVEALESERNMLLNSFVKESPIYTYIKEVTPNESRVIVASENFVDMTGVPGSKMIGMTMDKLFPPEFAAKISADDWAVVENAQLLVLDEDLNNRHFTTYKFPIKIGARQLLAGYTIDITERKKADEGIRKARNDYLTITNLTGDIIVTIDAEGKWTFLNDGACEFLGEPREELLGIKFADYLHPDDVVTTAAAIQEMVETKKMVKGVINRQKTPKGWRIVEWNASLILDEAGNYAGMQATGRDITERKQAEEKLRKSEKNFRNSLDNSPLGIRIVDADGHTVYANPALLDIYAYDGLEEYNKTPNEKRHTPKSYAEHRNRVERRQQGKDIISDYEMSIVRKDGEIRHLQVFRKEVYWSENLRYQVLYLDITERKQTEELLREQRNLLTSMFAATPGFFILKTWGSVYRAVNPAFCQFLGKPEEEIIGKSDYELFPHDEAEAYRKGDAAVMETGKPESEDWEVTGAEGKQWLHVTKTAVLDETGQCVGVLCSVTDITERKKAEEDMRIKDNAIASSINAIAIADLEGNLVYVNPSFLKMGGYDDDKELLGKSALELWQLGEKATEVINALQTEGDWQGELVAKRKDGLLFNAQLSASMVIDEVGNPIRMMASFIDITERKQIEEALRESEEKLSGILSNMSDVVWSISWPDFTHHYLSNSLEKLYGRSKQEFMDNPHLFQEVTHPDDQQLTEKAIKQLVEEGEATRECRIVRPDGSIVWIYDRSKMIYDENHQPIRVDGVTQDITERKKMQEEQEKLLLAYQEQSQILAESNLKLENSLDAVTQAEQKTKQHYQQEKALRQELETEIKKRVEFSHALVHELKTPLTPVIASIDALANNLKEEPWVSLARNVERGAEKLNERIDELLDIARGEASMLKVDLKPLKPLPLLRQVADEMAEVASRQRLSLTVDLPASLPLIRADESRLRQILQNLFNNAFKFTSEGTEITLRAREEGAELIVEVQDTGPGIAKQMQERIFDPYYREESDRQRLSGLGLGLALCKKLVELQGGRIWVESEKGKGSTFSFSVPLENTDRQVKNQE